MKIMLLLFLTISLSSTSVFSSNVPVVTKATLPETGSMSGTFGSEAPPMREPPIMNTDTIKTNQSSTVRSEAPRKKASHAKCIDRSGRVYSSVQSGYSACKNEMNK